MNLPVYTIEVTTNPGVQYDVGPAELEQLQQLGLVSSIVATVVPQDKVLITDGIVPTGVPVGQVWFDRTAS
jgi:hypothetical protein